MAALGLLIDGVSVSNVAGKYVRNIIYIHNTVYIKNRPITVGVPSKKLTLFACSQVGMVGSNPTQGMDVCMCVYSMCVLLWV
jgi:hypothetical protein